MEFEFNLSLEELKKYTNEDACVETIMLTKDSKEFKELSAKEKMVVLHLARASDYVEKVYFKMENSLNNEFKEFLQKEIAKGNQQAILTEKLFSGVRSLTFTDYHNNEIDLVKNLRKTKGLNFYPSDLSVTEFHKILNKMLDENKTKEVAKILTYHTMVVRSKDELKGIEYVDFFEELKECAKELYLAKEFSSCEKFNTFLDYQAKALLCNNQEFDCLADTIWAEMEDNKIDFTLCRESYDDKITESIFANRQLLERLKNLNIEINPKDLLCARVGIRNDEGCKFLHSVKNIANVIGKNMPHQDKYEQIILKDGKAKQTTMDLDIVCLSGDGARGGLLTVAENLPNDNKLSVKRGGGRKNIYHRQARVSTRSKLLKFMLCENDLKYFTDEGSHYGTICHETTHSFGPRNVKLGEFNSIIEECKADLGMFAFLKDLEKENIFSKNQCKDIIINGLMFNFDIKKPKLKKAHAVERIMILNKMFEEKAMILNSEHKVQFDFDQVEKTAKQMMSEVVNLQLKGLVQDAKNYVEKYFVWNDNLQTVADIIKQNSKRLCRIVKEPLKDYLMTDGAEQEIKAEIENSIATSKIN